MNQPVLQFIGKITIKSLRDYILDAEHFTNRDTILLHPVNLRELAYEYRQTFQQPFPFPYLILNVLILEDPSGLVKVDRIGIVKEDVASKQKYFIKDFVDPSEVVYKCGYCGNLVRENGEPLDTLSHTRQRRILEQFDDKDTTVKYIHGYCHRSVSETEKGAEEMLRV
ncbi:hypothetical protein QNI19_08100 [Cytophagaceae bacterium DM2B3-1]|uniref:Uncharacterized protein n=1 Tax=Xanthocytophaga flava TaxID=3048013 RepID=A0ABT7CGL8_9BACT|nr:hypothetical protein [Xanthocytophaga flavus]MDJ1471125.1 hypothetical protein [Xanthocytophaga flavus]MDJ1492889.1 hypothetical protein [Xanthocytophaga flavus]